MADSNHSTSDQDNSTSSFHDSSDADAPEAQGASSGALSDRGRRLRDRMERKAKAKANKRGRQAEQIEDKAEQIAGKARHWITDHRWAGLGVLIVVAAVVGVTGGYSTWKKKQRVEQAQQLWGAWDTANKEDSGDAAGPSTDPWTKEQIASVVAALKNVEAPEGEASAWLTLSKASLLLRSGEADRARKTLESLSLDKKASAFVRMRRTELLALTHEAEKKWAEAKKVYEQLTTDQGARFRDLGDYHVARMHMQLGEKDNAADRLTALLKRRRAVEDPKSEEGTSDEEGTDPNDGEKAKEEPVERADPLPLEFTENQAELTLTDIDPTRVPERAPSFDPSSFGSGGGLPPNMSQDQIQKLLQQLQNSGGGAP